MLRWARQSFLLLFHLLSHHFLKTQNQMTLIKMTGQIRIFAIRDQMWTLPYAKLITSGNIYQTVMSCCSPRCCCCCWIITEQLNSILIEMNVQTCWLHLKLQSPDMRRVSVFSSNPCQKDKRSIFPKMPSCFCLLKVSLGCCPKHSDLLARAWQKPEDRASPKSGGGKKKRACSWLLVISRCNRPTCIRFHHVVWL